MTIGEKTSVAVSGRRSVLWKKKTISQQAKAYWFELS